MRERLRMLTNIRYLPILAYFPRIGVCEVLPLNRTIFDSSFKAVPSLIFEKISELFRTGTV